MAIAGAKLMIDGPAAAGGNAITYDALADTQDQAAPKLSLPLPAVEGHPVKELSSAGDLSRSTMAHSDATCFSTSLAEWSDDDSASDCWTTAEAQAGPDEQIAGSKGPWMKTGRGEDKVGGLKEADHQVASLRAFYGGEDQVVSLTQADRLRKREDRARKIAAALLAQVERKPRKKPSMHDWPMWLLNGRAPTTLDLTWVPCWLTPKDLIEQLDQWGFAGKYNYIHVLSRGSIRINAVQYRDALAMVKKIHGFRNWKWAKPSEPARVGWCVECQGLDAIFNQYFWSEVNLTPLEADAFAGMAWYHNGFDWNVLLHPAHQQGAAYYF